MLNSKRYEILIVDDNVGNLQLLSKILSDDGFSVRPASSAALALRSIDVKKPDLILLDVKMPGMGGVELCLNIKLSKKNHDVPILFISAEDNSEEKLACFNAGGVDFIKKPFESQEVIARIKTHIRLNELTHHLEELVNKKTEDLIAANLEIQKEYNNKKEIQEELFEKEQQFRRAIEEAPFPAIIVTDDGQVLTVSRSWKEITGYRDQEILTINDWISLVSGDDKKQVAAEAEKIFEFSTRKEQGEFTIICKDGTLRVWEFSSVGLGRLSDGRKIAISMAFDVTERKKTVEETQLMNERLEQALIRSNQLAEEAEFANKVKSEFLSNFSHEIRTPLNSILGFTEFLSESAQENNIKFYLKKISTSGQELLLLIDDILDLSRMENGTNILRNEMFQLVNMLYTTIEMVHGRALKKNLKLEIEVAPDLLGKNILGDYLKLQRVLLNLLNNAIKFTENGEIKLVAKKELNTLGGKDLIFEVHDTGVGIPSDKQPLLFKSFAQIDSGPSKSKQGLGLGLSISKQIILMMKGEISVTSVVNKGSTFILKIPYIEGETKFNEDNSLNVPSVSLDPLRILLVDDSDENRALIQVFLKKLPYQIEEVCNGFDAILKFKENCYDIVFMDIQMPGMDGFEATYQIRNWEKEQHRKFTPIVALTAYALKEEAEKCLAAGCSLHVAKPISKKKLLEIIFEQTKKQI